MFTFTRDWKNGNQYKKGNENLKKKGNENLKKKENEIAAIKIMLYLIVKYCGRNYKDCLKKFEKILKKLEKNDSSRIMVDWYTIFPREFFSDDFIRKRLDGQSRDIYIYSIGAMGKSIILKSKEIEDNCQDKEKLEDLKDLLKKLIEERIADLKGPRQNLPESTRPNQDPECRKLVFKENCINLYQIMEDIKTSSLDIFEAVPNDVNGFYCMEDFEGLMEQAKDLIKYWNSFQIQLKHNNVIKVWNNFYFQLTGQNFID